MIDEYIVLSSFLRSRLEWSLRPSEKGSQLTWDRHRVVVLREGHTSGALLRMTDLARRAVELPVLGEIGMRRHESRIARHRRSLPTLSTQDEALLDLLDRAGAASRAVDLGGAAQDEITRAVQWLKNTPTTRPVSYLPLDQPNALDALYRWGLDETNLDIAERHIRLPVRYVGLEVKVERPRAVRLRRQARQWHLDAEDRRMLKIIVYLNDVNSENGPFEYLPGPASEMARRRLRCRPGISFLPDSAIADVVPPSDWLQVTGPTGTAVYADTGRLLHRLKGPTEGNRYSATFVYTSDRPYTLFSRFMPPRTLIDAIAETLTPRQRRALPDRRWQRSAMAPNPGDPPDQLPPRRSAS